MYHKRQLEWMLCCSSRRRGIRIHECGVPQGISKIKRHLTEDAQNGMHIINSTQKDNIIQYQILYIVTRPLCYIEEVSLDDAYCPQQKRLVCATKIQFQLESCFVQRNAPSAVTELMQPIATQYRSIDIEKEADISWQVCQAVLFGRFVSQLLSLSSITLG